MPNWNREVKHFGEVEETSKLNYVFKYSGPHTIKNVTSGCNCTAAVVDGTEIDITYNTNIVPAKLRDIGRFYQEVSQYVKVHFEEEDAKEQLLFLKAYIYPKEYL